MPRADRLPIVPASYFGIVIGLVGLAMTWRAAHRVWNLPAAIGEVAYAAAVVVWVVALALFAAKWLFAREQALVEARHPVLCCFIALVGVATMLIGIACVPYDVPVARTVFVLGALFALLFSVWRTGQLWTGGRDPTTNTAVLYLPTVGASFVATIGAAAFGWPSWGMLTFGIGVLSWFAMESVLLHRLLTAAPLAPALRPTLGIQLAPPVVGLNAYLGLTTGPPDAVAYALIGYALLQALILLRLVPWVRDGQPFTPGYWAFTFGITALAAAPLRMIERGDHGAVADLAPWIFAAANVAMAVIVLGTLKLLMQGRLLPVAVPASAAAVAASPIVTAPIPDARPRP